MTGHSSLKDIVIEDGDTSLTLGYSIDSERYNADIVSLFYHCPLETLYLGRELELDYNIATDEILEKL